MFFICFVSLLGEDGVVVFPNFEDLKKTVDIGCCKEEQEDPNRLGKQEERSILIHLVW